MPDNDTSKKGWPDLKIAITILTSVAFLASLLFVSGFSFTVGHNLLGLCDITDYVRIAPSWGGLAAMGFVIGTLLFYGLERPTSMPVADSLQSRILNRCLLVFLILGIVCSLAQFFYPGLFLAPFAMFSWRVAIFLFVYLRLLPGWVRSFGLTPDFALFIGVTVPVLALAFFWGIFFLPISGSLVPQTFRTITMKDHSKSEGRVVLELNRYVVVLTTSGKLTALQSSEIEAMDLRTSWSR